MIEIVCDQTRDVAYADSAEAALVAGRTLCEDAHDARPFQGFEPTVTFVDAGGRVVRARVPEQMLWNVRVYDCPDEA